MWTAKSDDPFRQPCEGYLCPRQDRSTFYCDQCDCNFCDECWDRQPAHRPNKLGLHGHAHEKIDRLVVERHRNIFEPSSNFHEQEALHKDDEETTWFGVSRDCYGDSVFEDYGQYVTLMAESLYEGLGVRYPQLVSFIGQTGAGKSTVVKMLINHQDIKTNRTANSEFPSPVVGSVNDNIPVSADVHLYADPETFYTNTPLLYADSEGLEGGETAPKAEFLRTLDRQQDPMRSQRGFTEANMRRKLKRKSHGTARKVSWANEDREKSRREYAVTELYPRLLYTFSDVVVFVLRNPKVFESAVLTKLIDWASASFEKSLGQPALPHIVIALNATDLAIDANQWNVKDATLKFFSDTESSIDKVPALQIHAQNWRAKGREIQTTKDLLECYYSSVTVVRIPTKGRYMLIDQQVDKLHAEIAIRCAHSHNTKRRVRMLSNSDDLQLYLQSAFDHFSRNLEAPFNFVEVALKINPIPTDFGGNILKLAVAVKDNLPGYRVSQIFDVLGVMVASCILLDIHRHRRPGTLKELLDDYYMGYCEQAFSDFCDLHWPCSFQKKNNHCVNFYLGHSSKGHQNAAGKVLASGEYIASFNYYSDLLRWSQKLEREMNEIEDSRTEAQINGPHLRAEGVISGIHLGSMKKFFGQLGSPDKFISHMTCFCCLRDIPEHPLACGHVLCTPCVHTYGVMKGKELINVSHCPIGFNSARCSQACNIKLMPPLAGARVLCLDGGGIKGIVELEVLRAIEKRLPPKIPIRSYFDLIVGTSTGGIIALGLGFERWLVDECIEQFSSLCTDAFTPR